MFNFSHYQSKALYNSMTPWFLIKVKTGKFLANLISSVIPDKEKRHLLRDRLNPLNPSRCVKYMATHYCNSDHSYNIKIEDGYENTIWICWLQGIEQSPNIIKNCINSVKLFKKENQRIILLSEKNLSDYAELPVTIIRKWKQGYICNAHFADILRVYLMLRYGGYWMDATCMLTRPIPKEIDESPVFLFRSHGEFSFTYIQNCFIHSINNHYIMSRWYSAIIDYWENEKKPIHYFLHHFLFVALLANDKQFRDGFKKIPIITDEAMNFLGKELNNGMNYTNEIIEEARQLSFVQKLNYKFPQELLNNKQSLASVLSDPDFIFNKSSHTSNFLI